VKKTLEGVATGSSKFDSQLARHDASQEAQGPEAAERAEIAAGRDQGGVKVVLPIILRFLYFFFSSGVWRNERKRKEKDNRDRK
jgi:hypothetical protein